MTCKSHAGMTCYQKPSANDVGLRVRAEAALAESWDMARNQRSSIKHASNWSVLRL